MSMKQFYKFRDLRGLSCLHLALQKECDVKKRMGAGQTGLMGFRWRSIQFLIQFNPAERPRSNIAMKPRIREEIEILLIENGLYGALEPNERGGYKMNSNDDWSSAPSLIAFIAQQF
jgi:hypothetical protein